MRNLLYTCLSYNENYFCLLELFLKSISYQSNKNNNFDLLLILDEKFVNVIHKFDLKTNFSVHIITVPSANNADIAMFYKFAGFEWIKEQNYEKILFVDVDTVFVKHPDLIFENINDSQLFVKQEQGDINDIFHCQGLYTPLQILNLKNKNINLPLNSGTFAFSTKSKFLDELIKFNKYLTTEMQVNTRHPGCDQTFFNLYFLEKDINCSLNKFVTICEREPTTSTTAVFHSVGGAYYHKYHNLKNQITNEHQ
jgi:hypothetical protein